MKGRHESKPQNPVFRRSYKSLGHLVIIHELLKLPGWKALFIYYLFLNLEGVPQSIPILPPTEANRQLIVSIGVHTYI